ncbi:hypothetical protein I317_05829 [Kwoniella heveanensis CBS 569]|uniref:Uncharacterized protein n=1 Tax=Kwoniella heveanensis BCC8398 TaxID=1296120 RepID=A0A1B9H0I9_9TREE|nr:hypothetical protein I316_01392 [Kwoniella heveanensis BCC8398]OCF40394.1 hypothetical protein I317_05829 [Kwoniella heveanensis CBS 569]
MDHETVRAAMGACDDLMALKAVPSESWAPYVAGIKRRLSESEGEGEGGGEGSPVISTFSSPTDSPLEEHSAGGDTPGFMPPHPHPTAQKQLSFGEDPTTNDAAAGASASFRGSKQSKNRTPRRASS